MTGKIIRAENVNLKAERAFLSGDLLALKLKSFEKKKDLVDEEQSKDVSIVDQNEGAGEKLKKEQETNFVEKIADDYPQELKEARDSLGKVNIEKLYHGVLKNLKEKVDKRLEYLYGINEKVRELEARYNRIIEEKTEKAEIILMNANEEIKKKQDEATIQARHVLAEGEQKAKTLVAEAEETAKKIAKESESQLAEREKQIKRVIEEKISEKVWKENSQEITRFVELLDYTVKETLNKRKEILTNSHHHLVKIALAIAKKVTKKISEEDEEMVVRNISESLKLIKGVDSLSVRINPSDFNISKKFEEKFAKMIEDKVAFRFVQDNRIEKGGCVIETEVGEVDARLSSQLEEIENTLANIDTVSYR